MALPLHEDAWLTGLHSFLQNQDEDAEGLRPNKQQLTVSQRT